MADALTATPPPASTEPGQLGLGASPVEGSSSFAQNFQQANPNAPAATDPTFPELSSIVPAEYKDQPWVTEMKDVPAMFKMISDQKTALSKRPGGIPQANASETDWNEFNKARGVPDDAKDYAFTPPEGKEFSKEDLAFNEQLRPLLKAAAVTPEQLAALTPGWQAMGDKMTAESLDAQSKLDAEFSTLTETLFGDRQDEVLSTGKALMEKYTPKSMGKHVAGLDNKTLAVLASVLDGIRKDYITADQLPTGAGAGVGQASEAERHAEGRKIMESPIYRNEFGGEAHEAAIKKVNQLFGTA